MESSEILETIRSLHNPQAVEGMARYGINPHGNYGVCIPTLREMAAGIGRDHGLALQLWASGIHDARLLASMIDDPTLVTGEQMDGWARDFDSWDVCDQCCANLLARTDLARVKALEWSRSDQEYVKRAGFVIMALMAVRDKKAADSWFEALLPIIEEAATDERNYVKKGVSWALREIGKRNPALNLTCINRARRLAEMDSRSARWIASDALRELTGARVQEKLHRRQKGAAGPGRGHRPPSPSAP